MEEKYKISMEELILLLLAFFFFFVMFIFLIKMNFLIYFFFFLVSATLILLFPIFLKNKLHRRFLLKCSLFPIFFILILIFVLFCFNNYEEKGQNLIPYEIEFDAYIVNNSITPGKLNMDLLKANEIWNEQNIFLRIKETFYIEEIDFLEESFLLNVDATNKSECLKYNEIISFSNKSELRLILLDSESNHRGRGCICGCDSIVVDIKKELSLDLTGWNIAHEFGHLFGQFDIKNRYNLMCDQLKVIKPSFLNKKQIYSLTRNTFISSSVKIYN